MDSRESKIDSEWICIDSAMIRKSDIKYCMVENTVCDSYNVVCTLKDGNKKYLMAYHTREMAYASNILRDVQRQMTICPK